MSTPATSEIRKRFDRARIRTLDVYVVESDPTIVEVESHHSGRTHTIVPNVAYCSCEDKRYRDLPCYHLIHLVLNPRVDDDVRSEVESAISRRFSSLRETLHMMEEKADQWRAADDAIDQWLDELDRNTDSADEEDVGPDHHGFVPSVWDRQDPIEEVASNVKG